MRKGMTLVAVAAVAAVVAWSGGTSIIVVGLLVAAVGLTAAVFMRPPPGSRWRRGWWLLPLAAIAFGASAAPPMMVAGWGAHVGVVAAVLLFVGLIRTRPVRDGPQARELLVEAVLAGLLVTYVVGALFVEADLTRELALHLAALGTEVAALTVALQHAWRNRELASRPDREVVIAVTLLVTCRTTWLLGALGLAGAVEWDAVPLGVGTAAALVMIGLALSSRQLAAQIPVPVATNSVLAAGHVAIVVAVVLAGPGVVTTHGFVRGTSHLLSIAVAGALLALFGVLHLVQLVRDNGRRAWRARHDALTGLPTEPLFHDRIDQAIARARRTGRGLAIAFVDLDRFKQVNDRDGHEAGDAVLRAVADRLRGALREQDTVARKSGDEFLVLLPEVEGPEAAEVVASKLIAVLLEPLELATGTHTIGASIGLALWPRDGQDGDELIRHADAAMYDVKDERGGAVRWYSRSTTARTRLRLTLATQLGAAIDDPDQLDVAYQPRVDLRDGRVEALVGLVRWHHPELGLITPRSFLPLAVEAGLARAIDLAVMEQMASSMARWRAAGWCDLPIVVHLADPHVGHPQLEEEVVAILQRTGLPSRRLELSLSEAGLSRGGIRAQTSIRDLAENGVRTTVSRFGTGAIALASLAEAPVTGVELASKHVATIGGGRSRAIDVAVAVATRLGLAVMATGVENQEQIEWLRAAGCHAARGPALTPPLLSWVLEARLSALAADHVDAAAAPTSSHSHASTRGPLIVSQLIGDDHGSDAQHPDIAAVLAAAVGLDNTIEERVLTDVLARLDSSIEVAS